MRALGRQSRLGIAVTLCAVPFALVILRVAWLQVVEGPELTRRAESQHVRRVWLPPVRGKITDRRGEALAYTMYNYSIVAEPSKVKDKKQAARALAPALKTTPIKLERLLSSKRSQVYLERRVTPMLENRVDIESLPGIRERLELKRVYPLGESAAHVVGFLNHEGSGYGGIEAELDEALEGRPGWATELRDALGNSYFALGRRSKPAQTGHSIELTLDATLQDVAASELREAAERLRAKGGSLIAVEPRTGEILAMASWPSFDPERVGEARTSSLRNRAIVDPYEPGSTFKLVAAAGALQDKLLQPGTPIHCESGTHDFGGYVISDHHAYETLSFKDCFARSSNIAFAKVGNRCGTRLYDVARGFGFGSPTGIVLAGEASGRMRPPSRWSGRSAATIAIGYEVLATPIQMAMAYAAVANDGILMRPNLIRTITDPDGKVVYRNRPQALRRAIDAKVARTMRSFMRQVMIDGTGKDAALAWVETGGKTGTTEKFVLGNGYSKSKHYASFVGMAPIDDPQIVCFIMLDEPQTHTYGGSAAAPVFRETLEAFGRLPGAWLSPEYPRVLVENQDSRGMSRLMPPPLMAGPGDGESPRTPSPDRGIPDVRGESLRSALRILRAYGISARVHGTGVVRKQSPSPGSDGDIVHLYGSRSREGSVVMASTTAAILEEGQKARKTGSSGSR